MCHLTAWHTLVTLVHAGRCRAVRSMQRLRVALRLRARRARMLLGVLRVALRRRARCTRVLLWRVLGLWRVLRLRCGA